ncbi:hypothetical protein [Novipirellula caenicola]|uniref:Uncharacterized protein n=1 Tax=Novipirellula caenicola TaxID=1536901 RepID=A0ABP9VIW3_9BACT
MPNATDIGTRRVVLSRCGASRPVNIERFTRCHRLLAATGRFASRPHFKVAGLPTHYPTAVGTSTLAISSGNPREICAAGARNGYLTG